MAEKRNDYSELRESLKNMEVGHSFFEPDKTTKDLYFLYQVAYSAGVRISMHNVENDEIYKKSGVRVWREPDKEPEDEQRNRGS